MNAPAMAMPHTAPTPDWHSARYLACLSAAAGVSKVQPPATPTAAHFDQQVDLLLDCGLAARFLAQLTFDNANSAYVRNRGDVLGGVRQSLSDNRLTVAATAMALLAVTDLQETLATFAAQPSVP